MKSKQVFSSPEFQAFLQTCRSYCTLLENSDEYEKLPFLLKLQKLLLELYSRAIHFRRIELEHRSDIQVEINSEELARIHEGLSKKIGSISFYWTVFDPAEDIFKKTDPVVGDLKDDLLDTYKDIKRELMVLDLGSPESIETGVWGMNFRFWHHWSCHVIDAIRTTHYHLEKTEKYK